MGLIASIKKALAPLPNCARCGGYWSDIEHQSWDPGWPSMPVGKEPVDHWYINPDDPTTEEE